MKAKNSKNFEFIKIVEPFVVAPENRFFNNLKHLLKKKYVYLSNFSRIDVCNTQNYNLDVLYGRKFLRAFRFKKYIRKPKKHSKKKKLQLKKKIKKKITSSQIRQWLSNIKHLKNLIIAKKLKRNIRHKFYKKIKSGTNLKLKGKVIIDILENKIKTLRRGLRLGVKRVIFKDLNSFVYSRFAKKYMTKSNTFLKVRKRFFKSKLRKVVKRKSNLKLRFKLKLKKGKRLTAFKRSKRFKFKAKVKKYFKRNLDEGKSIKDKNVKNNLNLLIKKNILMLIKSNEIKRSNQNLYININVLNYRLHRPLFLFFFKRFYRFRFRLFPRNDSLFFDFITTLALLSRKEVSIDIFATALSNILSSIHKKKHGPFLSLLTNLCRRVVFPKDSLICGMKITFGGRLFGKNRAKTIILSAGSPALNTVENETKHITKDVFTVYGVYGLQLWVTYKTKSQILPLCKKKDKLSEDEEKKNYFTKLIKKVKKKPLIVKKKLSKGKDKFSKVKNSLQKKEPIKKKKLTKNKQKKSSKNKQKKN